jgi:ATP-dependent Clp protease adaptor protein ClpS
MFEMSERPSEPRQQERAAAQPPDSAEARSMGVQEKVGAEPIKLDRLPPFHILLHNDDVNEATYVVETICDLTPLSPHKAARVTLEAEKRGLATMLTTHRERAELYVEQFSSKGLTVTMERAE